MQTNALRVALLFVAVILAVASPGSAQQDGGEVVFVAHRGGIVPGYPENTLAAFRHAIELGVHAIEIDLRGTQDGEVVIVHDETVDRTTDGRGRVDELTLDQLKALDAVEGERIPTYEEVLELVAGTGVALLLDIKESVALDPGNVVRLTARHDATRDVIVGVRTLDDLRTFSELDANLRTLGFVATVDDVEPFAEAGVDIIRLWPDWISADADLVARVHRLGRPVWVTAGEASLEDLETLIDSGVDGVLSDLPALASPLLSR